MPSLRSGSYFCDAAGHSARERCRELTFYQPGPLLTAAGMLIVDEICLGGTLLDGLRYFMHQRRYDPWAGTFGTNSVNSATTSL
ncbi:hypothetical protein FE391_32335 [Nonomuraea sp. KC401]|uniref:hypothetical protein n=1 Tax=unclassified Nonomuraea TaxID=2593643 RepID=UPI0010FE83B0|nr:MULTISPECIES: hypothetical protein [unclassified Nonomuraea]NBE98421.1 hypothetical protein [Nonomuraea sp. K271]TLF61078.1 hypothetical protein FE391_32335 [Nonomuraea sp. KC401]